MADQDQASTELTPGKVLNPVPVTPSRETERPAGLAFDVEQGADLPGVPAGDQTPKNPGAAPAQETGGGVGLALPGGQARKEKQEGPEQHRPGTGAGLKKERRTRMFEATDIREWRGHDVVDAEGHKIGELEAVYVDTRTDQPAFATVTVGMPTRHRLTFVPLDQAAVGPGYVRVGFDKKLVKDAPSIDTDGELPAEDEEAIFRHYGLTYQAGAAGERRLARR
jgi:PRC-barrel domain